MRYDAILFDFDGTIADTMPGIHQALQYAAERMGCAPIDGALARKFIGPPILSSAQRYLGLDEERATRFYGFFREAYEGETLFNARVYTGVPQLLRQLRAQGAFMAVASAKVPMTAAIGKALAETAGDVLCFLPGEGEIRKIIEWSKDRMVEFLPLYGSLPKEEQDRVFAPSARRKVILATSIAETSLTIEGITTVIDSGLMRVPRFSPGTGMTGLVTLPLTQDRAEQRRGRAGRVQAGVCYRLWTEAGEASRPAKMPPEILDADLCSLVLTSAAWGAVRRTDLPWLTPPPASAWDQAAGLLTLLGARDARGQLTERGRAMARLPMHPRLANMLLAAGRASDAARTACRLAAVLEEGATLGVCMFALNYEKVRIVYPISDVYSSHVTNQVTKILVYEISLT